MPNLRTTNTRHRRHLMPVRLVAATKRTQKEPQRLARGDLVRYAGQSHPIMYIVRGSARGQ